MAKVKLDNGVIIFISPDIEKTVTYYQDIFGFKAVTHYENEEKFAALYRDNVEIIVVQSRKGDIISNLERYGAGYDAYLDPEDIKGVDAIYDELNQKGADIITEPTVTSYGCYEFAVKDTDGRLIGIGKIKDNNTFFKSIDIAEK